jgi:hypothetical protein
LFVQSGLFALLRINRFFNAAGSIGNFKARVLAGMLFPLQIDMFNNGTRRPLPAPLEDFINTRFFPFKYGFDRTVAFIPDPT